MTQRYNYTLFEKKGDGMILIGKFKYLQPICDLLKISEPTCIRIVSGKARKYCKHYHIDRYSIKTHVKPNMIKKLIKHVPTTKDTEKSDTDSEYRNG